jgi:alpha-glucosidase
MFGCMEKRARLLAATIMILPWLAGPAAGQSSYTLRSPDQRIEIRVRTGGSSIQYDVLLKGKPLLQNCSASINIDQTQLGRNLKVKNADQRSVDQLHQPPIRQKSERIREHYNELRLQGEDGLTTVFRAYNEGVAYRLETSLPRTEVKVYGEEAVFNFAADHTVYYPQEESFFSHNERSYTPRKLSSIPASAIASLPAVVDAGGVKVAIAESDIEDYPGLWLRGTGGSGLAATFPPYPLKESLSKDRDYRVTQTADYIAVTRGARTYPWRILAIAENDGDLITNQLVWLLAKPSQIADPSWIRPGKVAWDWYNANNIYGVDFRAGINTQTYKYYIDFASKYGIEYIILDEGWYRLGNVLDVVPEMNIEEIVAYGKQKNVGVILWVVWKTLADQLQPALDQYEKWGIKGIKVDFMQRDDQIVMKFYHDLAREAAKRKMLVDFHGAQRSVLLARTWPNLITNEGVKGLEHTKWSRDVEPEHNVTLPFTRMLLGPMDFTPGAMLNATKETFAPIFNRPMALGTRCHQLAMYVVYESPLQMLADSPSNYLREPEAMEFLGPVPTVWDETRVLEAKLGDYVVIARRHGRDWYIGAMNDWTPRELEIGLSFLPEGNFQMQAYQDGLNADRMAGDFQLVKRQVDRNARLKIRLAPGGGWAARIRP